MLVPLVPDVKNVKVLNKNIVYSNIALSKDDLGDDIIITTISNIEPSLFDKCLKSVLLSNPDVTFNTIQYISRENRIYFYTDKNISTRNWQDTIVRMYNPVSSSLKILDDIKRTLELEDEDNSEYISLYDIVKIIKENDDQYEETLSKYESSCEEIIEKKYGQSVMISINDFDYKLNELIITFRYMNCWQRIVFSKNDDGLYLKKDESTFGNEVFALIGNILSELYDEIMKYKDFMKQFHSAIKSKNSNFLVDISHKGVSIYISSSMRKEFMLSSSNYKNEYDYECSSNVILAAIKDNEDKLFKKIFIAIDDCPKWSQLILRNLRKKELESKLSLEYGMENKGVKKLTFVKRLFGELKK